MNKAYFENNACSECSVHYIDKEIQFYKKWHLTCKMCGAVFDDLPKAETFIQLSFFTKEANNENNNTRRSGW